MSTSVPTVVHACLLLCNGWVDTVVKHRNNNDNNIQYYYLKVMDIN